MEPEEGSTKTADDSGYASAGADQAEAFANDPKNHVDDLKDKVGSKTDSSPSRMSQIAGGAKSFAGSKKAKIGGAGVGIAGLIIAAVLALLPLKIEALMKNIFQKRIGNKIEHMEEKRADKIVIKYLTKAGSSEAVYADGTLFGSLYKNWRLKNFEAKFTEKSGIKIEKGTDGKIKLTTLDGKVTPFANEADFEKYLNKGDLKGIEARRFIRDVTRSETHWIQVYKRHNLRKYMRNAYGIRKWSWFSGKEGKTAETGMRDAFLDSASEPVKNDTPRVLTCALEGSDCPSDDGGREKPYGTENGIKPNSATGDNSVKDESKGSISKAYDKAKQVSPSKLVEKGLSRVLSTFISDELASRLASKAVPIIGQILLIDQAARIDHFFHEGNADKALRSIHKVQYATVFAQYASIADNFKDPKHKMSGDEFNAVMTRFNGKEGGSAAFNDIFLNKSGGKKLDANLAIDDKATPIKDDYNKYSLAAAPLVGTLRVWYASVDGTPLKHLIDLLNSIISTVVSSALSALQALIPGLASLMNSIASFMSSQLLKIITPAVDGTETGAELINAIDAGGAVTGQDFSKSLGGHTMSDTQSNAETSAIAYDKNISAPSLYARLFSPDYPSSMINQFAILAPRSAGEAVSGVSSYGLAIISNPMNIFGGVFNSFTHRAYAGANIDLYGLQNYGYTEAELDQPLTTLTDRNHDGKINADDCKTNEDGTPFSADQLKVFNDPKQGGQICLLDVATAESLGAAFTTANDGGVDDSSSGTSSVAVGNPGQLASGTEQELAKQILANPSITFDYGPTGRIAQPFIDLAGGSKASTLDAAPATDVSTSILGAILLIAQTHKVNISSLTTGHSVGDVHSTGYAVDMNIFDGVHTTGRDSITVSIINILTAALPQGSGFGQQGCPTTAVTLPAGFIQFGDSCDHLHIQVPVGTP